MILFVLPPLFRPHMSPSPAAPPHAPETALRLPALVRRPAAWALFAGFWLLNAGVWTAGYHQRWGRELGFRLALLTGVIDALSWATLCAAAFGVAWLVPLERRPGAGQLLRIFLLCVLLVAVRIAVLRWMAPFVGWSPSPLSVLLAQQVPHHLLATTTFVGLGYGVASTLREREARLALSRLEAEVARANLRAARGRLQPDFLLGMLDAVSVRMRGDVEAADRLLVRLGEVLRLTFHDAARDFVPLEMEVEFVRAYLELEEARTGVRMSLADRLPAAARRVAVPRTALFVLAEPAARAAVEGGAAALEVEVEGRLRPDVLHLLVRDDAPVPLAERRPGAAAAMLRRLEGVLRGGAGEAPVLEARDRLRRGVEATLHVPLLPRREEARGGA